MNHPNREDLIALLYDELPDAARAPLAEHIAHCAECRAQLDAWRAVRQDLNAWQLPEPRRRVTPAPAWSLVKLAAAALVLIGVGFGLARLIAPAPVADTAAVRAAVAKELRAELRAELTRFAADQSARQQEYQAALTRALGRLEAQRVVDYANLRKDVETVAVRAEDELQSTRQDMLRLASNDR